MQLLVLPFCFGIVVNKKDSRYSAKSLAFNFIAEEEILLRIEGRTYGLDQGKKMVTVFKILSVVRMD